MTIYYRAFDKLMALERFQPFGKRSWPDAFQSVEEILKSMGTIQ